VLVVRWWFNYAVDCLHCVPDNTSSIYCSGGVVVVVRCAIAYNARVIIPIRLILIGCRGGAVVVRWWWCTLLQAKKSPYSGARSKLRHKA
jgi:hypothetical protein